MLTGSDPATCHLATVGRADTIRTAWKGSVWGVGLQVANTQEGWLHWSWRFSGILSVPQGHKIILLKHHRSKKAMCFTAWLVYNRQNWEAHFGLLCLEGGQLLVDPPCRLLNMQTGNAIQQHRDSLPSPASFRALFFSSCHIGPLREG